MNWLELAVAAGSIALGGLFLAFPKKAIQFQIAFYRRINWKMEPVSWDQEVRNTRLMGALAILATAAALCFKFLS